MNKQWELINARDKNKNEENARQHELEKTKLEKYSEIVIKVAGAGGILIVLAQLIFGQ